ncbi:MAG: hypothetical protein UX39_C0008G0006 [Candidatus Magasanikbacteria bacterium GW2011_GWA2_46_17]|uniref:Uncharacterized protein n=1 Tax=Candidatus Magasanikbacteria bacterium GW2011_GWA2_46_17 TaxID=1619042 RepID=A0A0G1R911_9BACT|nr:MAG: hypothetical protein UX39_C0008G0006 [Candidatus Magasanikbacteria bacterium GW2011_GWA2_46_17]
MLLATVIPTIARNVCGVSMWTKTRGIGQRSAGASWSRCQFQRKRGSTYCSNVAAFAVLNEKIKWRKATTLTRYSRFLVALGVELVNKKFFYIGQRFLVKVFSERRDIGGKE